MADDNQKSRNILENSNFLKHRCCLEDRAFLSNSIELVQRENFLALIFTFSGVNIYWLGQDENNPNVPGGEAPVYSHPSMFR